MEKEIEELKATIEIIRRELNEFYKVELQALRNRLTAIEIEALIEKNWDKR